MLARLNMPLRLTGAVKTAKAQLGELSLQSLMTTSLGFTCSTRGGEANSADTTGML